MSNALITMHLGQCGNQIGLDFWKSLCNDHGIAPDGEISDAPGCSAALGNPEVFFYQADDKHYVPRSVLVDLEPRVINSIMNSTYAKLFTDENILLSPEGGGAGNNWAKGYIQTRQLEEELFDIVDRISEDCDSLNGLMICHSMAGGTGSGMGSYILERLGDRYPKKTVQTLSVFPHQDEIGDVIVQAYNSLLMLDRLITYTDSVLVLHNGAFQSIIENQLKNSSSTYMEINALITKLLNVFTNPLRFPTYQFSTLTSLIAPLTPTSSMHFLTSSFTPWTATIKRKKTARRIMYDLLESKNMSISTTANHKNAGHVYLAILDIIHGDFEPSKLFDAIGYIRENQYTKFAPWVPDSLQVILGKMAPSFLKANYSSGFMLANHTGISDFLEIIVQQFDKLRKKKAFLGQFQSTGLFSENFSEMDMSRDVVDCLLQEYNAATKSNFLQWRPKKSDDVFLQRPATI